MITFILNHKVITTELSSGLTVLDFLRYHQRLTGTKEGCREGDCGACLILLGRWDGKEMNYAQINSCLLPLGEVAGKHLVTIEGLNRNGALNPIQQAIVDEGASQCGFCSPGMIVALTGFLMNTRYMDYQHITEALDGNICRCTGYTAVKRAASLLCKKFPIPDSDEDRIKLLVRWGILPDYFLHIPERLGRLPPYLNQEICPNKSEILVAGGTDLFVQQPEELRNAVLTFLSGREDLKGIRIKDNQCHIGAATTVEELKNSAIMKSLFPKISHYFQIISSTPIRHRATVGGNIANASPIGDITIFLLALDAKILLNNGYVTREVALKDFFKGYKQSDKDKNEIIENIRFPLALENFSFNFEKVSRRKHLDIASVNSAIQVQAKDGIIKSVHLSAGGVAPIPLYLSQTAAFLKGKPIDSMHIREAAAIAQAEISPISDVRGTSDYKRLLLRQLIFAHFIECFGIRGAEFTNS